MNGRFQARLHAATLPTAGVVVEAGFVGSQLRLGGDAPMAVDAAAIAVEVGGFDRDQLFLRWTAAEITYALTPLDAGARATLLATAPPALAPRLATLARRSRGLSATGWLLASTVALLLVAGFGLVWGWGRVVDWAVTKVPASMEADLGASTMAELRRGGRLLDDGPALDAVRTIGERLTAGSRYDYEWAVLDDPTINAFAAPGGKVVVHTGLLAAAKTPEELAGVLAHEVQHIERRHTLKGMVNGLGVAAVATLLFGDVSAMAGMLAYQLGSLHYSRDLEAEADRLGLAALVAADIDPAGMARFFRTLAAAAPQMPIALLSSHPATDDRIAAIDAGIAALPARSFPPLPIDWAAVQASLPSAEPADADADTDAPSLPAAP